MLHWQPLAVLPEDAASLASPLARAGVGRGRRKREERWKERKENSRKRHRRMEKKGRKRKEGVMQRRDMKEKDRKRWMGGGKINRHGSKGRGRVERRDTDK